MRTTVLALDLGIHCGHALLCMIPGRGTVNVTGTWHCSARRVDGSVVDINVFENCLRTSLECSVDKVFYKDNRRHKGTQAAHVHDALKAKMVQVCDERGIPHESLSGREVKWFATGNRNAREAEMIAAARRFGHRLDDEDYSEAGAIFAARHGAETLIAELVVHA